MYGPSSNVNAMVLGMMQLEIDTPTGTLVMVMLPGALVSARSTAGGAPDDSGCCTPVGRAEARSDATVAAVGATVDGRADTSLASALASALEAAADALAGSAFGAAFDAARAWARALAIASKCAMAWAIKRCNHGGGLEAA